jgi:hypothetical protein
MSLNIHAWNSMLLLLLSYGKGSFPVFNDWAVLPALYVCAAGV